jgi:hypothetical protein
LSKKENPSRSKLEGFLVGKRQRVREGYRGRVKRGDGLGEGVKKI